MSFSMKNLTLLLTATVLCSSFGYSSNNKEYNGYYNINGKKTFFNYNNFGNDNSNNNKSINYNNSDKYNNTGTVIYNSGINVFGNKGNNTFSISGNKIDISNDNINNNGVINKFYQYTNSIISLLSSIGEINDQVKKTIIRSEYCEKIDKTDFIKQTINKVLKNCKGININNKDQIKNNINLYNGINKHVVNRQHVGTFAMIKDSNNKYIPIINLFDNKYNFGKFDEEKEDTVQIFGINKDVERIGNEVQKYFQNKYKYNKSIKYDNDDKKLLNDFLRPIYTIEAYKLLIEMLKEFNTNVFLYNVQIEENSKKNNNDNVLYNINLQRNPKSRYDENNKNLVVFGLTEDNGIVLKTFYNKANYRDVRNYNDFPEIDNNKSKTSNIQSDNNKNEEKENIDTMINPINRNNNTDIQSKSIINIKKISNNTSKDIIFNDFSEIDNNKSKTSNTQSDNNKSEKNENSTNTTTSSSINNTQNSSNINLQNNNITSNSVSNKYNNNSININNNILRNSIQNNYNINPINDNIQNDNNTNIITNSSINNIQNSSNINLLNNNINMQNYNILNNNIVNNNVSNNNTVNNNVSNNNTVNNNIGNNNIIQIAQSDTIMTTMAVEGLRICMEDLDISNAMEIDG